MKRIGIFLAMLVLLAFGFAMTSCSTIPAAQFVPQNLEIDELLGPIPGEFITYAAALEAAKKAYPRAQAVVYYSAIAGNNIIPMPMLIGFYAVTLKVSKESSAKKGLF